MAAAYVRPRYCSIRFWRLGEKINGAQRYGTCHPKMAYLVVCLTTHAGKKLQDVWCCHLLDKLRFLQLWWAIKGGLHVKIHVRGYLEKGTTNMSPKRCLKTCTHSSHYHGWRQEALDLGRIVACLQERHFPISTNFAYPTSLDVNPLWLKKRPGPVAKWVPLRLCLGWKICHPCNLRPTIMFYPPWN